MSALAAPQPAAPRRPGGGTPEVTWAEIRPEPPAWWPQWPLTWNNSRSRPARARRPTPS